MSKLNNVTRLASSWDDRVPVSQLRGAARQGHRWGSAKAERGHRWSAGKRSAGPHFWPYKTRASLAIICLSDCMH